MSELSVIIPFVNEWPTVAFTVRNIAEELRDRVDFEIITIDNYCDEVANEGRDRDRSGEHMEATAGRGNPWHRHLKYDKKLSHWQAKNLGVQHATGKFYWFCDAHCIISRNALYNMLVYYREHHERLNGTLHLPLTYHIMEYHKLIYKPVIDMEKGLYHYSFSSYRDEQEPYRVPCMSTCGMMMSREIYKELGGWPEELGIYGGGENFINYSLAVLGKTVNIMPGGPLTHHGEKRGYSYRYDDLIRNRCIAVYMFGGVDRAERYIMQVNGKPVVLRRIFDDVINTCYDHRQHIKARQQYDIDEWFRPLVGANITT